MAFRGMGVPPMSFFACLARRANGRTHGQDARATNSVPAALILAKQDRIIDNAATVKKLKRLAGQNLRVVELPGCHTLEFEPNPQPFYDELTDAVRDR